MSGPDPARRWASLLKKLRAEFGEPPLDAPPQHSGPPDPEWMLDQLVFSFLLWESTTPAACAARDHLHTVVADCNDLRVCLADEITEILGGAHAPHAAERALRLKSVLGELFRREHAVTLAHLVGATKREAEHYLESLEGITPFVTARMLLVCFGGHALPVDAQLRDLLVREGIVEPGTGIEAAVRWLERQVKAADLPGVAALLRAWTDSSCPPKTERTDAEHAGKHGESAPRTASKAKPRKNSARTTG